MGAKAVSQLSAALRSAREVSHAWATGKAARELKITLRGIDGSLPTHASRSCLAVASGGRSNTGVGGCSSTSRPERDQCLHGGSSRTAIPVGSSAAASSGSLELAATLEARAALEPTAGRKTAAGLAFAIAGSRPASIATAASRTLPRPFASGASASLASSGKRLKKRATSSRRAALPTSEAMRAATVGVPTAASRSMALSVASLASRRA